MITHRGMKLLCDDFLNYGLLLLTFVLIGAKKLWQCMQCLISTGAAKNVNRVIVLVSFTKS